MRHESGTGSNKRYCYVVLCDVESIDVAISELNGASLFNAKVLVTKYGRFDKLHTRPNLNWGWFASADPDPGNADVRGVLTEPPVDMFAPLREQRRMGFTNIPLPHLVTTRARFKSRETLVETAYRLLHDFNVNSAATVWPEENARKGYQMTTGTVLIDFDTREEAKCAQNKFDGRLYGSRTVIVRPWQIPLKYLGASWDTGRGGEHFSGKRDQGSAIGTNYEEVRLSQTIF
jgi:hypothetical protein